jgi:D-hexose-6-phosphate mutarotase
MAPDSKPSHGLAVRNRRWQVVSFETASLAIAVRCGLLESLAAAGSI